MINSPCTGVYPSSWSDGQRKLGCAISLLLRDNLGASPISRGFSNNEPVKSPFLFGLLASLTYIFVFCGTQYLIGKPNYNSTLLFLSIWGGCYLGFAVTVARFTSNSVQQTITDNIITNLSDDVASIISDELNTRFKSRRIHMVSLGVSAVAAVASAIALAYDLGAIGTGNRVSWSPEAGEIAICSLGFFILYVTAARATDVARFYGVFAAHLQSQSISIFTLDPARSALVADITSVGRWILFFWFGIALSIVTLIPLFFRDLQLFILAVVPITMFFSIAFGTIVFLTAEHSIRRIVQDKRSSTLAVLEQEIIRLFDQRDNLNSSQWEEFTQLKAMHKELSSAGGYRSYLPSLLSLVSPLLGPAVAAVAIVVGRP